MNFLPGFTKAKAVFGAVAASESLLAALVQRVEASFPSGTPGHTKLDAVKTMLASVWSTIVGIEATFEDAWPTISALASTLVGIYNMVGYFHKAGAAPGTGA